MVKKRLLPTDSSVPSTLRIATVPAEVCFSSRPCAPSGPASTPLARSASRSARIMARSSGRMRGCSSGGW